MSLIDSDAVRAALNKRISHSPDYKRPTPNRFWDHLSFCATLFWGLRRVKHLRAGQLIGAALSRVAMPNEVKHEAELAYHAYRQGDSEPKAAFIKQITPALVSAERAHALSRMEDDSLANLIEEFVHEHK
jgi:hypothetical protein